MLAFIVMKCLHVSVADAFKYRAYGVNCVSPECFATIVDSLFGHFRTDGMKVSSVDIFTVVSSCVSY